MLNHKYIILLLITIKITSLHYIKNINNYSKHHSLNQWVDQWAKILQPDSIYWCDGSQEEYKIYAKIWLLAVP